MSIRCGFIGIWITFFVGSGAGMAQTDSLPALPMPSGTYNIGTQTFHLVDSSRVDPFASVSGRFREMMVQVWYPAELSEHANSAPYLPDARLLEAMEEQGYYELDEDVIRRWRTVQTQGIEGAPLAQVHTVKPLLLFSHGLGVSRFHYTTIVQEMASHGFIVAVIDHLYGGMMQLPGGRIVTANEDPGNLDDPAIIANRTSAWVTDASAVLDQLMEPGQALGQFARYIDPQKIGMMGHSLGGAAALEACLVDQRFMACANLDGAPFGRIELEGLGRPTLVMASGPDYSDEDLAALARTRGQWERMGAQYKSIWDAVFSINELQPGYLIGINGTGHMSYSDAPFVMPETITRFGGKVIDPERGFEIMMVCIRAFFEHYLDGEERGLPGGLVERYPEISIDVYGQ